MASIESCRGCRCDESCERMCDERNGGVASFGEGNCREANCCEGDSLGEGNSGD